MLGIRRPDRHALPVTTPIKCTGRQLRSPPARAGSFFGALQPMRDAAAKVLLTDPIADAQACRRELVFMPRSRHP